MRLPPLSRNFIQDRRGVAAIEFALIAPLLIGLLLGAVTEFDQYRASQIAEKATFTVADIMSRENETDTSKISINRAIFVTMSRHTTGQTTFRVSSIQRQNDKFKVCWSNAVEPMKELKDSTIPTAQMPLVGNGDTILLLETTVLAKPLFEVLGLPTRLLSNFSAIRSRSGGPIKNSSVPSAPC